MDFIKKSSSAFALKVVTLGCFSMLICHKFTAFIAKIVASVESFSCSLFIAPVASASQSLLPHSGDEHGLSEARKLPQVEGTNGSVVSSDTNVTKKTDEMAPANLIKARAPKKTVSINENVEEIIPGKKRNRMIYEMDKEENVKPLKSILKVGSRLKENLHYKYV